MDSRHSRRVQDLSMSEERVCSDRAGHGDGQAVPGPWSERIGRRMNLAFLALSVAFTVSGADAPKVELLWPEGAPGAKGTTELDKPSLTVYPPAGKATGTAVVV